MAKKKLNKKVAIIGSAIFILLVLAAIGVVLRLSQNPQKFIEDGDASRLAAQLATDEEIKEQEYKKAERSYLRARARAKTDSLKVDILFKLADFFLEIDKWPNILGCWEEIIRLDKKNVAARFGQLKYSYIMADTGAMPFWKKVASEASGFIDIANEELLSENPDKYESFTIHPRSAGKTMETYLYLLKGRATLMTAKIGAVTDPEASVDSAIEDLEKVVALEPDNVQGAWNLAQALFEKGRLYALKNDLAQRDAYRDRAKEILKKAAETAVDDPQAHADVLKFDLQSETEIKMEEFEALEGKYQAFAERFNTSAVALSTLADFYSMVGYKKLNDAIEYAEKATEFDKENVSYAITASAMYYRRYSIYGTEADLYKSIDLAKKALELPNAQDKPGPRYWANKNNRVTLQSLLAYSYIEQIIEARKAGREQEPEIQKFVKDAEQAVHQIEQIYGSGDDPVVVKWKGMLDLAKGNRKEGLKKLYSTYLKFKSTGKNDIRLSYTLAKLFENTNELGAATEFFGSAFSGEYRTRIDDEKPEALLDLGNIMLNLKQFESAVETANFFEKKFWPNERSRLLRANAYIGSGQFDEIEEELAKCQANDPNILNLNIELLRAKIFKIKTQISQRKFQFASPQPTNEDIEQPEQPASVEFMTAQIKDYTDTLTKMTEKLLAVDANFVSVGNVLIVCNNHIFAGRIDRAKEWLDKYLEYFPDNKQILFKKQTLAEPDPANISPDRLNQIEEQILLAIEEPDERAEMLGEFYQRTGEPNKAVEEFKKVINPYLADKNKKGEAEMTFLDRFAFDYLFIIALNDEDWDFTEKLASLGRRNDLDGCEGNFFATQIALKKEDFDAALPRINECLKQRPIFSLGFMIRSNIYTALGNNASAIDDARKARTMNPMNGQIAKVFAKTLLQRNLKLADNVTADQVTEAKEALVGAMRLNPSDWQLRSLYAEYISEEDPEGALAMCQGLQKIIPNVQTAVGLGKMAMKIAAAENDPERQKVLYDIAGSAFEQALALKPEGQIVIRNYAEYYRVTGQEAKAEELLKKSQNPKMLWQHFVKIGNLEQAREILAQLYEADKKDTDSLKGLIGVSKRMMDIENLKKYFEELLLLEDNAQNRLTQIDSFLQLGLVKEAELKLQSFKEKYPDEKGSLLLEARLATKKGQMEDALKLVNQSLESNQDNPIAWRLRGEINRFTANYDQATIDFKKSKALLDDPVTRISLAKAYIRAGRDQEAVTELRNTLDNIYVAQECYVLLEEIYKRQRKATQLKNLYSEVLEKYPESIFWYTKVGMFSLTIGDIETAEKLFAVSWQRVKEDDPKRLDVFDGYLGALISQGKVDMAFEIAGKHIDGDLAPLAYWKMAEIRMKREDRQGALNYAHKAIDKAGENETFVFNTLRGMFSLFGHEEVEKICTEKLQANPDSLAPNLAMFNLYNIVGEYNKAIKYISKVMEIIEPNDPRQIDFGVDKATVLQAAYNKTSDKNYLNKAVDEYKSLLIKMPNNTSVLNNLAFMLAENDQNLEEALEYAKRAYQQNPNHPGLLDTYAYALYKNAEYKQADEYLQASLQQFEAKKIPVSWDVYEHLGMIKEKLGDKMQAYDAYKQAMELLNSTKSGSEEIIERIENAIERLSM